MQRTKKQRGAISLALKEHCVFEYQYRDASNYKAWGEMLLSGVPSQNDIATLRARLESDEYFVAEQVGIPALYQQLWDFGGPNLNIAQTSCYNNFIALLGFFRFRGDIPPTPTGGVAR